MDSLFSIAAAFAVALVLSPMIRSCTAELNHSVGRVWPFSMSRCLVASTPGCAEAPVARIRQAQR